MTELVFRNVDVDVDDPVETWPSEAVLTALERGSLQHWRRLAAAVRVDPWGSVARTLEQALRVVQPYGVHAGLQRMIEDARVQQERAERESVAHELRILVERSGLPAAACAHRLGTSASRLSTYLSAKVTPSAAFMVRARQFLG